MAVSRKLLCCLFLLCCAAARAGDAVTLYYNERPPYLIGAPDGSVSGLTASVAAQAFKAAGIEVHWQRMPYNRQLESLREGGARCMVGLFKTPERERHARFSKPIYRDLPTIALMRGGLASASGLSLQRVLATPDLRVLVKENYSYGRDIDAALAKVRGGVVVTTAENVNMLAMLYGQRADLMFIGEEEYQYLMRQSTYAAKDFSLLRFADLPEGEARHIMCSMDVPQAWMRRLDREIHFE